MDDHVQLEDHRDPSTDELSPSIIKKLDLGDNIEEDQQQQRQPPSLQQQLSNVTVCSLLEVETDSEAIKSLELLLNSVVKIFWTSIPCDFNSPWQVKPQVAKTSSGFIIKNRWILSNAHAVANQSIIRIRKHEPLTFNNDVPRLEESIIVVGYPIGGDNLSVTKGAVSRVVMSTYSHSVEYLLTTQIDAAINPGNSGGPAIQGKQVVGMSFQGRSEAQSIGYIIPVLIIKHLLDDIELHNRYTAFPRMVFQYQSMEHSLYRNYLKLNDDQHGILVTSVEPACVLSKILQKDDVIIAINNVSIADDGTIYFRRGERLNFGYFEK
ncbi:unnamed protein product [Rotaria sp. Silwood1]|nr:unnamed protein product [Rotaria sp. Silwood1]